MGKYLSAVGLAFDILGAWLVAYDIFHGFFTRNKTEVFRAQQATFKKWRKHFLEGIFELPDSLYPAEDKQKLASKIERKYTDMEDNSLQKEDADFSAHSLKSFKFAFIGICMLTLGFALQLVGVLITE
jgi:hypothetical protein